MCETVRADGRTQEEESDREWWAEGMRRGAERKMNEKGNGIEKKKTGKI